MRLFCNLFIERLSYYAALLTEIKTDTMAVIVVLLMQFYCYY